MMRWYRGNINKFWNDDDFIHLDYAKQDITYEERALWVSKGYDTNTDFTGYMYTNKNIMPAFAEKFKDMFTEFTNMTYTFYKMETQQIMPEHVDHFRTYINLFKVQRNDVVRILVMLQDWKPGHYLEINGTGIINWVAGDYYIWENDVPHAASNIGDKDSPRYTLQITATKKRHTDFSNN
jgi:hypothetical protein